MAEGKGVGFYVIILIVGAVLGTVLGHVLGAFIPKEGPIHDLFVTGVNLGISTEKPLEVDLQFFKFVLGISLKLTVSSVLGVVIAVILMKRI